MRDIERNFAVRPPPASRPRTPKQGASRASGPRFSGRMTARVITLLERRGQSLAALGVDAPELRHPDARVHVDDVDRLLEAAAGALGASGLALALAAVVDMDTYGAAGRLLLAGRTLCEGFELALRHQRLWADGNRFTMTTDATRGLSISFAHPGRSPVARAVLAELALVEIMQAVKRLAGAGARPSAVSFAHAPLGDPHPLRDVFGFEPAFLSSTNTIVLSPSVADVPLAAARDLLRSALEHDATKAQERLATGTRVADRVRETARDFPSLAELSRRLRLPVRTLQRSLAAEGTSYFEVLDGIRRDAAAALTAQGRSEKEIAFDVGFEDPRALHRARRRWARRR